MELDYDGDTSDASQYCVHGTFIGSWWGPDYLCGWCEDGVSVEELRGIRYQNAIHAWKKQRGEIFMWLRVARTIMQDPKIRSLPIDRQWSIREWSVWITAQKLDEFAELLERRPVGVRSTLTAAGIGSVL